MQPIDFNKIESISWVDKFYLVLNIVLPTSITNPVFDYPKEIVVSKSAIDIDSGIEMLGNNISLKFNGGYGKLLGGMNTESSQITVPREI